MLIMQLIKIIFIINDISNIRNMIIIYIRVNIITMLIIISIYVRNINKIIRICNWP